jgi:hypothetical protein
MSIRSVHSARAVRTNLSAIAFIRGACGAVVTTSIPQVVKTRVERGGELGVPVPDQVGEPVPGVGQAGGELAGQSRGLGRGREPGDAQQVHMPRAVLDD